MLKEYTKEYTKGVYREICWRNPLKEPTENLPEAKSFQRKVFTESRFQMVQKRRTAYRTLPNHIVVAPKLFH